jgi:Sec-independent protein secretion pathway component TatC
MMLLAGIGAIELGMLGVAAVAVFLLTSFTSQRWLWALGLVGCVALAVVTTPADPVSTLLVAVPCCGLYALSAFAWKAKGKTPQAARD